MQARVAHDLLERYPRAGADLACLSLWLLGFDIDLRRVRMAYDESAEHHRSMLDLGGKSREESVGQLAETFGRQWAREKGAPSDVRAAIADCALAFLEVFYGTGSEFAGAGLAEQWRKVAPFMGGSSGWPDNPSDDHLAMAADYLHRFASFPVQREMVRTATDYELIRARRLLRFVVGCLRRFDRSADCRDDIESVGGWTLVVLGRPVVPILVAVLRQDRIREEVMYWLLDAATRLPHKVKRSASLLN